MTRADPHSRFKYWIVGTALAGVVALLACVGQVGMVVAPCSVRSLSAIATGNTFVLKPSEQVPLTQELVFNLIEIGQMRKTQDDRREHFNDVFDFDSVVGERLALMLAEQLHRGGDGAGE